MIKTAATLAGLTLLACIFGVNPHPIQNHLATIAFTFPKILAFNLSVTASIFIFLMRRRSRLRNGGTVPNAPSKIVDFVACLFLILGFTSSALHPTSVTFLLQWMTVLVSVVGLIWITTQAATDQRGIDLLGHWLLLASAIVVIFGIYDGMGGELPWKIVKRPTGILGNRSDMAAFCVVSLPLAIGCLYRELNPIKSQLRLACLASLNIGLMCLVVLCRSRAAWVGLGVMACFYGVWWVVQVVKTMRSPSPGMERPKSLSVLIIFGLLISGAIAAVHGPWSGLRWTEAEPFKSSALRLFEVDRGTGLGRVQQYQIAMRMVAERPLIGFGPGSWRREVGRFVDKVPGVPEDIFVHTNVPNSEMILIATETGILGVICIFVMFGLLIQPATTDVAHGKSRQSLSLVYSCVGFGVMAFLDPMSVRQEILAYMCIAVGILRTESMEMQRIPWLAKMEVWRPAGRMVVPGILLFVMIFAALQTYGSFVFLTGSFPYSLESLPAFIPFPPYGMNNLSELAISGPDPCGQSRHAFERAVKEYPYERKLLRAYGQTCQNSHVQIGQENATWARSLFFRGYAPTQGDVLTEADLEAFGKTMKDANIKYAYLFSGPFQADGSLPDFAFSERARDSIRKIKQAYPGLKILPWVGGIQGRTVRLGAPDWMEHALASTSRLIDTMPIDGVHLDFEFLIPGDPYLNPVDPNKDVTKEMSDYDAGLIEFHRRLRRLKPNTFISSVVVSSAPETRPWKKKHSLAQLEEISRNVNQLSFLYYDTHISDPDIYKSGMRDQLRHIQTLKMRIGPKAPQYLMAIGTFVNEPALRPYRDLKLENIPDTLLLMKQTIGEISPDERLVDGLAIYCEWLTSADQWTQIQTYWTRDAMLWK